MSNVRAWYLGGMVDSTDAAEKPMKKNVVQVADEYEVSDGLKKKLNAIVADEYLAYITYQMCQVSMTGNKQHNLEEVSKENAWDEYSDHFEKLVLWMQSKNIEVVTSVHEMEKITNCTVFTIKDRMQTKEIVEILITAEKEAISAYEKLLDDESVKYDLRTMLSGFLNDEREHLKKLEDIKAEM